MSLTGNPLLARLLQPRVLLGLVGLGGLVLVGGGIVLARTMNLAACPLCILQRMLYLLLGVQALAFTPFTGLLPVRRLAALAMAGTAATGAWIAAYQTWLQRFAKGVSCTADQPWWEQFVNWAGTQSPLLFEATGLCSEAGWKFLGLSIAEWSLAIFTAMTLACLYALFATPRRQASV